VGQIHITSSKLFPKRFLVGRVLKNDFKRVFDGRGLQKLTSNIFLVEGVFKPCIRNCFFFFVLWGVFQRLFSKIFLVEGVFENCFQKCVWTGALQKLFSKRFLVGWAPLSRGSMQQELPQYFERAAKQIYKFNSFFWAMFGKMGLAPKPSAM